MEPAATTADFESLPGVLPTAIESQQDPFVSVEEPIQAQTASNGPNGRLGFFLLIVSCYFLADLVGVAAGSTRPRRGDKTPAKFDEFTVIKPMRGRPARKRVAEVQPTQQQEEELFCSRISAYNDLNCYNN